MLNFSLALHIYTCNKDRTKGHCACLHQKTLQDIKWFRCYDIQLICRIGRLNRTVPQQAHYSFQFLGGMGSTQSTASFFNYQVQKLFWTPRSSLVKTTSSKVTQVFASFVLDFRASQAILGTNVLSQVTADVFLEEEDPSSHKGQVA